ncbi:MAG: RNA polymerase sigma factor [Microscillaceae bacterium]|jgi:RNA polymerase sigma-70 factor (ECF subfamily)|nr:RNA polymerase sigma factor [Microscillaceae bacterium]
MPKLNSEAELVKGCQEGNRLMQRRVYEAYSARMLAVCRRYVKNEFDAEEVLVNGFLKVFDRIGQFKSEGSFEGWIRRIMVNESLNHLRKQRIMYAEVEIENVSDNLDYSVFESELDAEELLQMIDQMPAGYRTVFNLYAIEGYSHKEIAESLGITESTSKSQLSRARLHLQKLLTDYDKKLNINHG